MNLINFIFGLCVVSIALAILTRFEKIIDSKLGSVILGCVFIVTMILFTAVSVMIGIDIFKFVF